MSASKPVVLRSAANPTVRHLIRMRDNRARRKAGRVIVDGWRETHLAIEAGMNLVGLFVNAAGQDSEDAIGQAMRACYDHAESLGRLQHVTDQVMQKIAYGQSPRGVVAEFEQPTQTLAEITLPDDPLLVILDRVEKPGNVGAVFRCAEAVGVNAVLLCESGDIWNPNTIRSSQGGVFHVPSAAATQSEIASFLDQAGVRVVAARVEASTDLWESALTGAIALLLGNEAHGLGDRWQKHGDQPISGIRIPMMGSIDSLNISVSAAVMLYEAVRQRR